MRPAINGGISGVLFLEVLSGVFSICEFNWMNVCLLCFSEVLINVIELLGNILMKTVSSSGSKTRYALINSSIKTNFNKNHSIVLIFKDWTMSYMH